jgi:regulator of RNase E activity RraA
MGISSPVRVCLPPVVGYATTATFRSAYPAVETDVYKRIPEHIEAMQQIPEPRIVIIQDLDEPPVAATLGEVMARLYRRFGAVGYVTNGAVRDLAQVEKLGFALFSSSVIVAHGYPHFVEVHAPVHVAGLTVRPGDLIHADANGVVSIPLSIAAQVAEACEEFVATEKSIMDFLEGKEITPSDYRHAWEKTQEEFDLLSARLRKVSEG